MSTIVPAIEPQALADGIRAAWAEYIRSDRRQGGGGKRLYVYASSFRSCTRQMALEMTEADKLPPWSDDSLANFRRGKDRERDLISDLKRVGRNAEPAFELVGEEERFELRDQKGRVAIVGKVDARIKFLGGASCPVECKSWNPNLVARIQRFEDLFENRWTRAGAYQLLAYLLGANEPLGFLLLDRNGLPALLPVELFKHLDRIEDFLKRAELALDHKEAGTLPDYVDDSRECRYCGFFGSVCNPPTSSAGAEVLLDPDLVQALERRQELKDQAREFDNLDDYVKKALRGVERGIAGPFLITGKWGKATKVEIQPDGRRTETVDPKGRFTLSIEKV